MTEETCNVYQSTVQITIKILKMDTKAPLYKSLSIYLWCKSNPSTTDLIVVDFDLPVNIGRVKLEVLVSVSHNKSSFHGFLPLLKQQDKLSQVGKFFLRNKYSY